MDDDTSLSSATSDSGDTSESSIQHKQTEKSDVNKKGA